MKAHRGSRGIAVFCFNLGSRWWWVVNAMPWQLYPLPPERDPVPIEQEVGWAPGPVWMGAVNLALTAIRSPDSQARSELLCRLRYPSPRRHLSSELNVLLIFLLMMVNNSALTK
jgi:hypothetical protein